MGIKEREKEKTKNKRRQTKACILLCFNSDYISCYSLLISMLNKMVKKQDGSVQVK